ncbi:actin related protein 2/3 complex [Cavenderia fasciculata]|uniref:Actin-related protein 2/3 complex subunit 3 n=1 Tax=Cavenderia fasciculata TaxID=261658 RepID=F4QDF7_CACFS|nr:actin related protein 2/3 complex [Cavenderia fasciculata]EGG14575.1 actin related protein 2/3 complex [Cavenderia fasciculata]|eukprot:XP_004366095.1 actin related protein 2/3 complex [Cavenderia fasciculata]
MVYHSSFNDESAGFRTIGNFPILPIKTAHKGPAPKPQDPNAVDAIDEALDLFKANILFRTFEVQGNGDRVLIYLTLYITKCLLKIANLSKADAEKQLFTMAQEQFSIPGETSFPLGGMITIPAARDAADNIRQALTQLRLETGIRLVQRVYATDPARPNKWWMAFSKRKFLGKAI